MSLPPSTSPGINWTALISGIVGIGSAVSMATGHPALGAIISSPDTANAVTAIVGGIGTLFAMFSPPAVKAPSN